MPQNKQRGTNEEPIQTQLGIYYQRHHNSNALKLLIKMKHLRP